MNKKSKSPRHERIRILIADDHPVVREGLGAIVRSEKDMQLVSEAANGQQAVQQFLLHRPDVLLVDLRMPQMNGIETIQAILKQAPDARIIVLSTYNGDEDVYSALKAGAKAYLLKDSQSDQLLESIRMVYSGRRWIPPEVGVQLANRIATLDLTKRQTNVLELMVGGKSNKEIGVSLGITEATVKIHVGHILRKLRVTGRSEAIRVALARGIVHLNSPCQI